MERKDFEEIVSRIKYKDWRIRIDESGGTGATNYYFLQVIFNAPDNHTGIVSEQRCRKWQLSKYMRPSEVVRTAYKAVLAAEEHEVGEHFKYKDVLIFNPHVDVEALVELVGADKLDVREEL